MLELQDAIVRRRMVRNFLDEALPGPELERVLDLARRAPSAGNTAAVGYLLLDSPARTGAYWDVTLPDGPARRRFRWQGLLRAPVLVVVTTSPEAYVDRYGEPDKVGTGRGAGLDAWPVPYWWVDAGACIQNLLLLAVDRGWGACLFGPFDHEPALRRRFALPRGQRLVGTVALGFPAPDEPGRSQQRQRPPLEDLILRPQVGGGDIDAEIDVDVDIDIGPTDEGEDGSIRS